MQTQQLVPYDLTGTKPFLKWAGGKSRLLHKLEPYLPPSDSYERYHEPFLGGGAMFFHLRPPVSFLSDRLLEVVVTFRVVRDYVKDLVPKLEQYEKRHRAEGKAFYKAVRETDTRRLNAVDRAARLIYLNKTCYNGIYRVNSRGKFNVPMGVYKNPRIVDADTLLADSVALASASIRHLDFSSVAEKVKDGDFVYLDPPYSGRFTGYHQNGFGMKEQERLAELFGLLHQSGARLMMNNGPDESIARLYKGFRRIHLESRVVLSGEVKGRKKVKELLVINYNPKDGKLLHSGDVE